MARADEDIAPSVSRGSGFRSRTPLDRVIERSVFEQDARPVLWRSATAFCAVRCEVLPWSSEFAVLGHVEKRNGHLRNGDDHQAVSRCIESLCWWSFGFEILQD